LFPHHRDFDELARRLMSEERRSYQNPLRIARMIGVRKGMTVVDMGCGPGFFTLPLARLVGPKGKVYAVEANRTMLKHLRDNLRKTGANGNRVRVVHADVSKTGIPSASADIVLLARILHDIEDKKAFLSEVKRICKQGGRVIDLDWKKIRMNHGPPFSITLSKPHSEKILRANGLRVVGSFNPGKYHYAIVATPMEKRATRR
jgi:ubiquinone/menaquinone biosynthesis C-methylase UbiE